jgi:uncharacterized protein YdeI (YjbR/CyaY-like superfamily)
MSARAPAIQKEAEIGVLLPRNLIDAFDGDEDLLAWVGTLRPSWQREIARWVEEPKSEEARARRCAGMAERLLLTMEAEEELPGFLARRLKGTRDAWAGWERMSVNRRRDFLLMVFGAQSEGARENQVVGLVEAAVAKGKARSRSLRDDK